MISRIEFAKVMAFIAAATQKPASPETVEVYYELLGDLELSILQAAARRVVLEHKWATLPSVAELREAAVQAMMTKEQSMPAQEAWSIAWRAAGRIDPDIKGEFIVFNGVGTELTVYPSMTAYALADVPVHVRKVMDTFGLARLVAGKEPIGVMQAQFCQTYTNLQLTAKRDALLPLALRNDLDRISKRPVAVPPRISKALAAIGTEP